MSAASGTQADVEQYIKGLLTQGPIEHVTGGAFNALYNQYTNDTPGITNEPKTRKLVRGALNALEHKGEIVLKKKGRYTLYMIGLPDTQSRADAQPREFGALAELCERVLSAIQTAAEKTRGKEGRRYSVRLDLEVALNHLGSKHDVLEARHYLGLLGLLAITGTEPSRYNVSPNTLDREALRKLAEGSYAFGARREPPVTLR